MRTEQITGTTLKQWFINAYIDLEKNKPLIYKTAKNNIEKTDINNLIYCLKNIVETIENLPENADCEWITDTACETAKNTALTKTSIKLYQYLATILDEIKPQLTPIEIINIINKLDKKTNPNQTNNILNKTKEQIQYLPETIDIEATCQVLITASQIAIVETVDEKNTINYQDILACIILSAIEYAWKEKEFTSNVVTNMIENLVKTTRSNLNNTTPKGGFEEEFEVTYAVETTQQTLNNITRKLENNTSDTMVVGKSDVFGIGHWIVSTQTKNPLSVLPIKTPFTKLTIQTTKPQHLQTYSNIQSPQTLNTNVISIFEKQNPKNTTKQSEIKTIACIQNLSLIEPITRTNTKTIYKLQEVNHLKTILETTTEKHIIVMPSTPKDLQIITTAINTSSKRNNIIIAPTTNDLDIKHLCEQIVTNTTILNEHTTRQQIENQINEIHKTQRSITITGDYENIEEIIKNFITSSDRHITAIIDSNEIIFLKQRIEEITQKISPQATLEIIVGNNTQITISTH